MVRHRQITCQLARKHDDTRNWCPTPSLQNDARVMDEF